MSVIIRLQGLPWTASAGDIRMFFEGLNIPDGGVHIVGGERGDAFIAFTSDEDARLAMQHNNGYLQDSTVQLFLSSKTEMQNVIAQARDGQASRATPRQNFPPMDGRPNPPRYQDSMSRFDHGDRENQRRQMPMNPYEPRGPRDNDRSILDTNTRGLRSDQRHPPDMSQTGFHGNRDGQRRPPDAPLLGPRSNRDAPHQQPDTYPIAPRGQREEKFDFPHDGHRDYRDEHRQRPGVSLSRTPRDDSRRSTDSPSFRDSLMPSNRSGDREHVRAHAFSASDHRGFRDDQRRGLHRSSLNGERQVPENPRRESDTPLGELHSGKRSDPDGHKPSGERFNPNCPPERNFRNEDRHGTLGGPREIRTDMSSERRGPDGQQSRGFRDSARRPIGVPGPGLRESRVDERDRPGMHPFGRTQDQLHSSESPGMQGFGGNQRNTLDRASDRPRNGQRPSAPPQPVHNFRDQDRRGPNPPPRFQENDRAGPIRQALEMAPLGSRGAPPPRQRGPPGNSSEPSIGPRDHDARVANPFKETPEDQAMFVEYSQHYGEEKLQYEDQNYHEVYPSDEPNPVMDWDSRPPRSAPILSGPATRRPQTAQEGSRNRTGILREGHIDDVRYRGEERMDEGFPPRSGQRPLLPDPDLPRMDPSRFKDRRDEQFDQITEYGERYDRNFEGDPFEKGFGNEFHAHSEGPEPDPGMLHRLYAPRGRFRGGPPGRPMLHRPPGPATEFQVRVRNMPYSVTYSSLRKFFEGSMIPRDGIKLINDNQGQRIGLGFVKFLSPVDFEHALSLSGHQMDGRSVDVKPCSREEFENAVDSYPTSGRPHSPKRQFSDRDLRDRGPTSPKRRRSVSPVEKRSNYGRRETRYVVQMREVPYRATVEDIRVFFNQLEIANNGSAIIFDQDSTGKPNGIVFVEFKVSKDCQFALQRNNGRLMNRIVTVHTGDPKDMDRVREKTERRRKPQSPSTSDKPIGNADSKIVKAAKSDQLAEKSGADTPNKESSEQSAGNISYFCVHLKGLQSTVTKKDVEEFFRGLDISPKGYNPILKKDGSCTGDAFIEFVSPKDCQKATLKDQELMGDRKVAVQPISKANLNSQLQELRKKALEDGQQTLQQQHPRSPPLYFMLGAQNLPFSVSIGEILNFFRGYNPVPESIRLHYNNEGRPTGDAVIGFMTESECHRALRDLNSRLLGRRNVRLYLA